jgi:hypothetical protein
MKMQAYWKNWRGLVFGPILIFLTWQTLFAQRGDVGAGLAGQLSQLGLHPRTLALGKSYTTLSFGPAAVNTNPAGLLRGEQHELLLFHGNPVNTGDVVLEYMASSFHPFWIPVPEGWMTNFGFSAIRLFSGQYVQMDELGREVGTFGIDNWLLSTGSGLSWAGAFGQLDIGITLRYEHRGFSGLQLKGVKEKDNVWGTDFGILFQPLSFPVLSCIMDKIDDRYSIRPFIRMKVGLVLSDFPWRTHHFSFFQNEKKNDNLGKRGRRVRAGISYEFGPFNNRWSGRIATDLAWIELNDKYIPLEQGIGGELSLKLNDISISGRIGWNRWYGSEGSASFGFGISGGQVKSLTYGIDAGLHFFTGLPSHFAWGGGWVFLRLGYRMARDGGYFAAVARTKGTNGERLRKSAAIRALLQYPMGLSESERDSVALLLVDLDSKRATRYIAMVGGLVGARFWVKRAVREQYSEDVDDAKSMARKAIHYFADAQKKNEQFSYEDTVRYVESLAITDDWKTINEWIGSDPFIRYSDKLFYLLGIAKLHIAKNSIQLAEADSLLEKVKKNTKEYMYEALAELALLKSLILLSRQERLKLDTQKIEGYFENILKRHQFYARFNREKFPNYAQIPIELDRPGRKLLSADLRPEFILLGLKFAKEFELREWAKIFEGNYRRFFHSTKVDLN